MGKREACADVHNVVPPQGDGGSFSRLALGSVLSYCDRMSHEEDELCVGCRRTPRERAGRVGSPQCLSRPVHWMSLYTKEWLAEQEAGAVFLEFVGTEYEMEFVMRNVAGKGSMSKKGVVVLMYRRIAKAWCVCCLFGE